MTGSHSPKMTQNEWLFLAVIILTGAFFRLWSPGQIAVEHFDEGVYASNNLLVTPKLHLPGYPVRELYAPPLVPFLSEMSRGESSWSPILPGLIMGILTVPAVWCITRIWFGPLAGMIAGLLAALSDFHILYSRSILTDVPLGLFLVLAVLVITLSYNSIDSQPIITKATGKSSKSKKKRSGKNEQADSKSGFSYFWILAGLLTSLAWWTKYNGWLPLAIGLSGLVPWLIFNQERSQSKMKYLICWGLISVLAYLIWLPVLFGLSESGGYSRVAANHKGYLVGIENWINSLVHQYQNHLALDGILSHSSLWVALVLSAIFTWNTRNLKSNSASQPTKNSLIGIGLMTGSGFFLAGLASWIGTSFVLILINLVACVGCLIFFLFKRNSKERTGNIALKRNIWLLMAWFFGLALSTPLYRAYPRLTLPWLISCWIGTAAGLSYFVNWVHQFVSFAPVSQSMKSSAKNRNSQNQTSALPILATIILTGLGFLLFFSNKEQLIEQGIPGWQDRTGLKNIASQIVEQISIQASQTEADKTNSRPIQYLATYGQPAIFYHLGHNADLQFQRENQLDFAPLVISSLSSFLTNLQQLEGEQYLVISQKTLDTELKSEWNLVKNRFEQVEIYPYSPSKLVSLNEFSPTELSQMKQSPLFEILLFRVK